MKRLAPVTLVLALGLVGCGGSHAFTRKDIKGEDVAANLKHVVNTKLQADLSFADAWKNDTCIREGEAGQFTCLLEFDGTDRNGSTVHVNATFTATCDVQDPKTGRWQCIYNNLQEHDTPAG